MDARRELARLETILRTADPLSGDFLDAWDAMDEIDEAECELVITEVEWMWAARLGMVEWMDQCR